MSAFSDAIALLDHADAELPKIKLAYEASLNAKQISPVLLVEIKNVFENIRSALDFVAHGVHGKHCAAAKKAKIYFPYAIASQTRSDFARSGRIDACIPGITQSRPDVATMLEEMQHFGSKGFRWLPSFMTLTNENKHQRLVPQTRKETKELRVSGGGASISLGQGASISLGQGASISIGGAVIRGGQTFDANNPPRVEGGKVEVITWVSSHFETTGDPVLPFVETAAQRCTRDRE